MITVVISTRKVDETYIKRIKDTAGVPVEFLIYENDNRKYSLTELYNRGLKESHHDVVVFLHDDLVFEKNSKWGLKFLNTFKTTEYGILGKAGTIQLPKSAQWWEDGIYMVGRVHHQQTDKKTGKIKKWASEYSAHLGTEITPVVVVDGLIFAVHKDRIKKNFDENIKGFHMYEIDFCIANHLEGVKIGVLYSFDILHKSIGETNQEWESNRYQVVNKYGDKLPIKVDPVLVANDRKVNITKQPFVSIVILMKGKIDLISNLITSIGKTTQYYNFEIIIADTGSTDDEKKEIRKIIGDDPFSIKMVEYNYYNFAKINNDVVRNHLNSKTEIVLFCNNDIVFVNDCLSLMVDTYLKNRHTCGTVGARLHFENNNVQHAGMYVGKDKESKIHVGHIGYKTSYQYSNKTHTVAGNTAALLLITKELFLKIGCFNENYEMCFEDVELNLQTLARRCKNYICGEAVAYHYESQTREPKITSGDYEHLCNYIKENYTKISEYVLEL